MKKDKLKKGTEKNIAFQSSSSPIKVNNRKSYFNWIALTIVILFGIIIYSNSFDCSFQFDDYINIVDNTNIPELTDFKAWWNFNHNRIVAFYSFALNIHFNQFNVWGYHLVNLIIHLINSCLVWWLTKLIFSSPVLKDHKIAKHVKLLAFFTALLFVSHPLATQSVTYIVQRLASMVAMFYLLSIALYLKARLANAGNITKTLLFTGSLFSAVLAMCTKENAFTLPFTIILVEFFFVRTRKINIKFGDYRLILLVLGLIGFIIWVTLKFSLSIFNPIPPSEVHTDVVTPINYLLTQFSVIVKYIQLLLLPSNQMVDYDFPLSNHLFEIRTLLSLLLHISLIILAIFLYKNYRMISFGIFWFFLTLSIESSLIPIPDLIYEHRTYLPSFGFFLILSSVIFILFYEKFKFLAFCILALIVCSNSYLTFQRNKVWKDTLSLWSDNVRKAPNLARPVTNRGVAYKNLGQWDKALADYTRALEINPNYTVALLNRGAAYAHFDKPDKAIIDYSKAIKLKPNFTDAYSNRGAAYSGLNEWEKAIDDYTKAISINPNNAKAYYNRGLAFGTLNLWEKAISDYSSTISINPNFADAYCNRGLVFGNLKQLDKAIADYSKAILIDSKHAKAYSNRGVAYATLQQWDNAILDYSKAIAINPNYANAYFNRANAFENIKEWEKAIDDYSKVIAIDPNNKFAYSRRDVVYKNLKSSKRL